MAYFSAEEKQERKKNIATIARDACVEFVLNEKN